MRKPKDLSTPVKYKRPQDARDPRNAAPRRLPKLSSRPTVLPFAPPSSVADAVAELKGTFGVPNATVSLPGGGERILALLRGFRRAKAVHVWRIWQQQKRADYKLRDFSLEKNSTRDGTVCAWCQGPLRMADAGGPSGYCSIGCAATLLLVAATPYKAQAIIGRGADAAGVLHCPLGHGCEHKGRSFNCRGVLYKPGMKKKCIFEVDHVERVCDGHGVCELGNLRGLCPYCHMHVTKAARADKPKQKKKKKKKKKPAVVEIVEIE